MGGIIMQDTTSSATVSDLTGVRRERFFHVNIPTRMAAAALCYPQMSGYYDCQPDYCCSRKSHLGMLLMHVTAGTLAVCCRRGEVDVGPGETVLFETYTTHVYCAAHGTEPSFYWLHFDGAPARALADYVIRMNHGILFKLSRDYAQRFSHLIVDLSQGQLTELQQSARIYELLSSMERSSPDATPGQRVAEYIHQHYAEPIPVSEMATVVNLSPSHFSASFREEYGISPHQYLILYRLSIGYNLVCNSAMSIEEICDQVGYSSASAFIAAFSRKYGITPAALRKAQSAVTLS